MTLDDFLRAFEALVEDREDSDDPGEGNYGCEDCRACNNCRFCIGCDSCEDCTYCEESIDCTSCTQSKRCVGCKKVSYCEDSRDCRDSRYLTLCVECTNSVHCLACVGLDGGEFYVLNQKRTRKEYFALLKQVQALMLGRMDGGWRPPTIGLASEIFDQVAGLRNSELSAAPWLAEIIEIAPEPEDFDDVRESEATVQRPSSMITRPPPRPEPEYRDYGRPRERDRDSVRDRDPSRDYGRDYREPPRGREPAREREPSSERDYARDYSRPRDYGRPRERDYAREGEGRTPPRSPAPRDDYGRDGRDGREPEGRTPPRSPAPRDDYRRGEPERGNRSERGREPSRSPKGRPPTEDTRELEVPASARNAAPPPSRADAWSEGPPARPPAREDSGNWIRVPPAFGTTYADTRDERGPKPRRPRPDYGHDLGQELGTDDYPREIPREDSGPRSESSNTHTFQRDPKRFLPEQDGFERDGSYEQPGYDGDDDAPGTRTKEQPTQPFMRAEGRPAPTPAATLRARLNTPRPPARPMEPPASAPPSAPASSPEQEAAPTPRAQEPSSPWIDEQQTQTRRLAKRGSLRRAGRPKRPSAEPDGDARESIGAHDFDSSVGEGTHTGLRTGRKPKRR